MIPNTAIALVEDCLISDLSVTVKHWLLFVFQHDKTGLRGFRPGLTQTGLYSHGRKLEAINFGYK